jgi:hypothetical protein
MIGLLLDPTTSESPPQGLLPQGQVAAVVGLRPRALNEASPAPLREGCPQ